MFKIDKFIKKRAFTLFELILVIFIIGLIYSLIGISFDRFHSKDDNFKFENLKELLKNNQSNDTVKLVCYDLCQKCVIFKESKIIKDKIELKLDENLEVFKLDEFGDFREIEFNARFIGEHLENICFEFKLYPNGSSSEYIVHNFGKYYIFDSYFKDVNVTDDLSFAKEALFDEKIYPTDFGDYYDK